MLLNTIHPLKSNLDLRICPYCSRPFWKSALAFHIESSCASAPAQQYIPPEDYAETNYARILAQQGKVGKTKKRKLGLTSGEQSANETKKVRKTSMTKKRRLALEAATAAAVARGEKPPTLEDIKEDLSPRKMRKPKKDKSKTTPKPKDPVDIEKQCGVPLPNGGLCARSLTCKTHSMNAKRSVRGRSAPYDVLLTNYQKKNQIKLASLSNSQQLADENEAFGAESLDPEEEVQQVMEGVLRSRPVPLEQKVLLPTRIKHQFFKMREMLAGALLPRGPRTSSALGSLLGRVNAINPNNPSELHFIRPINILRPQHLAALKLQQQQLQQQKLLQLQQQQQQAASAGGNRSTGSTPTHASPPAVLQQYEQQQQQQQQLQQQQLQQLQQQKLQQHQLQQQQLQQQQLQLQQLQQAFPNSRPQEY